MNKAISGILILGLLSSFTVSAADGLISTKSQHSVEKTADKLEKVIKEKGLTLFARINHKQNAEKVELKLRPTEVVIFGNPKVGTQLMQCTQTVAIDLPQKALIWEDVAGKVWFSYNDPAYLKKRHKAKGCDEVFKKISKVLKMLSKSSTSK